MSFSDAIGKLQSVIASLGTEETKKTEKKEEVSESSLFKSSIEDVNEETDITGIEIDYSQAAYEVTEQLFTNREIHRNNNDAKEFKERVFNELNDANIPEDLKDELAPLYNELCETTDTDEREAISAEIKHICLQAEKEGVDGSYLDKLDLELELNSTHSSNSKSISELYQQLAEVDNDDARFQIQSRIEQKYAENEIEASKVFNQLYIREFGLSEEQVDSLSSLYAELAENHDEWQRDSIYANIKLFCAEQGIDYNGEMIQGLNLNATRIANNQNLAELYDKMSNARTYKQREIIGNEINYAKTKAFIEEGEIEQKMNLAEMNIDDEAKEKVLELFDELSGVTDSHGADKINAKIAQVLAEAGVDLLERDYALLQLTNTNLQMEKENLEIYEELMHTTNPQKINDLNLKLQNIYESYGNEFDSIHKKISNATISEYQNELNEMYNQYSEASNANERNKIETEIVNTNLQIDELENREAVNNILEAVNNIGISEELTNKLSFLCSELFFDSDSTTKDAVWAEISKTMQEAKAEGTNKELIDKLNLDLQYSLVDITRNNELKDLNEKLSKATSDDERISIQAKIQQKEEEYEQEKNYLESQMFMADLKSDSYSRLDSLTEEIELPENAKNEFVQKYTSLIESTDIEERDIALDKLKATILELNQEYSFDPYGQVMRSINLNEIETRSSIQLSELYSKLSNAKDADTRNKINAEIRQVSLEYQQELESEGKKFWMINEQEDLINFVNNSISSSNLPKEIKEELSSNFNDYINAFDNNEKNMQLAKLEENLSKTAKEYGFDENSIQKEVLKSNVNINHKLKLASLKQDLLDANSKDERDSINDRIQQVELDFQQEMKYLNHKYN